MLYHVNESGNCVEVLQADGGIKRLLHHESRSLLVVITESLVLGQFSVAVDGSVTEINRVCGSFIYRMNFSFTCATRVIFHLIFNVIITSMSFPLFFVHNDDLSESVENYTWRIYGGILE